MRRHVPALALLGLAACVSPDYAPDAGVGFQSYDRYMQQQAAAAPAMPMSTEAPSSGAASIAADTMAALRGPAAAPAAPAPVAAPVAAPAPAQIAPPSTGATGANVAAFALATSHPVGQKMYRRINPLRDSMYDRACARYPSDALAQEAFLAAGGPGRDRHGLDPDGDGYACRWDPAPFRLARQAR